MQHFSGQNPQADFGLIFSGSLRFLLRVLRVWGFGVCTHKFPHKSAEIWRKRRARGHLRGGFCADAVRLYASQKLGANAEGSGEPVLRRVAANHRKPAIYWFVTRGFDSLLIAYRCPGPTGSLRSTVNRSIAGSRPRGLIRDFAGLGGMVTVACDQP